MTHRILFVCPNLQAGGAERHWSLLLPRLSQLGLSPRVLTLDGKGPFYTALQESGVPISTVANAGRWRNISGLHAMLREPTDLIVSRATSADALSMVASRVRPSVRWAVNWHTPSGMSIHPRKRAILQRVLPRADRIIVVCSSQIDDLTAMGVRRDAVTVIANGTDFAPSDDARAETRRRLGLAPDQVAVLHVGRLEPQKRVDRFIDVVHDAQSREPHIVGLIAGAGPDEPQLRAKVDASGARVGFLGRRDDMSQVLAAVDVLCLMSDYEALPFVVLEAMASRRPVVATSVGGLADVVVSGETGVLVSPDAPSDAANALVRLAADPGLRNAMGTAGRRRQQLLYTAERMSGQYAQLLTGLAG